jgi:type I restriction enzyme S subunit
LARDAVKVDPSAEYPNVGVLNFGRGLFAKPAIEGASTSATTLYRIRSGQFVYSRLFAFEGAYAHVPEEFDGRFVSQEFPTFNPDCDHLDATWLASFLRSKDHWAELSVSSKGLGVRRQRVQPEAILRYELWLPPIEDQHRMMSQVAQMNAVGDRQTRRASLMKSLVLSEMNRVLVG